ncbi:BrnT family toxin [Sphingosinicella sp.]|uniref:BrnT family toxin n=1 Tax=Sphingosinicella sp. TaxID=1917971 RepID=UPI0040384A5E
MAISFDPAKRNRTLAERGLDFADAEQVFAGPLVENPDDRFDYGEERFTTVGYLGERMVIVVWTPRGERRHIISMRKANERERKRYREQLG